MTQETLALILEALSKTKSNYNKRLRKRRKTRRKSPKRVMAAKRAARKISKSARTRRAKRAMRTKRRLGESQTYSEFILTCKNQGMSEEQIMDLLHTHLEETAEELEHEDLAGEDDEVLEDMSVAEMLLSMTAEGMTLDEALGVLDEEEKKKGWVGTAWDAIKGSTQTAADGANNVATSDKFLDFAKHVVTTGGKVLRAKKKSGKSFLGGAALGTLLGAGGLATGMLLHKGAKLAKKEADILAQLERRQHQREPDIYPHPQVFQPALYGPARHHIQQPPRYQGGAPHHYQHAFPMRESVEGKENNAYLKDIIVENLLTAYRNTKNEATESNDQEN